MKIIVPMAGRGSRLRPHTLTVPKPLIPIAGKPIVQRLVEDISKVCDETVDEIAFIIGDFGNEIEKNLINIAESLGAKGTIYHQEEALGTAHAILCAKESLTGNVVVAFADTLFKADFTLDNSADGIIWVKQIENPSAFGVVKLNDSNEITDFIEKPETFVSDLAIIGIYYFSDGEKLSIELQYLIDNNIKEKGEFQLTNALENMKAKGVKFKPGEVTEWLDCGNKEVTVNTNNKVLTLYKQYNSVPESAKTLLIDSSESCNGLKTTKFFCVDWLSFPDSSFQSNVPLIRRSPIRIFRRLEMRMVDLRSPCSRNTRKEKFSLSSDSSFF